MTMFNRMVDEGRVSMATSSRNATTNSGGTNRPAADGTATVDEASAQTNTNGGEKIWTSNEFWEFVDTLLSQAQAAAAQGSTVVDQQKFLKTCVVVLIRPCNHSSPSHDTYRMFTGSLQTDMKTYPPGPSQLSTPSMERVTIPWLRHLNENLTWINH